MTVCDQIPECLERANNIDIFLSDVQNLEILELLKYNTTLRKLNAVQKRHLESLAEGPVYIEPGKRLWRSGEAVEKAYIIVSGTVSFVAKRRNAGSAGVGISSRDYNSGESDDFSSIASSLGERMRQDAAKVRLEVEEKKKGDLDDNNLGSPQADDDMSYELSLSSSGSDVSLDMDDEGMPLSHTVSMQQDSVHSAGSSIYNVDYERLNVSLQKRADNLGNGKAANRRDSESSGDYHSQVSYADTSTEDGQDVGGSEGEIKATRRRSSRDRNANRQLNRLYNRRAFTAGLVFSKGHFLGDISKMVAGLLSSTYQGQNDMHGDDNSARYGFGEKNEGNPNSRGGVGEITIHEQEGDQHIVHSSTLAAGKDGCVVLVFPKSSLILFLDEYPGTLLSLLGTQVVL